MSAVKPSPLLRFALNLDAGVSSAIALVQLLLTDWLARATLLPSTLLLETGVIMGLYAGVLFWLARRNELRSGWVLMIVLGNLGWALGCVALGRSGLVPSVPLGVAYLLMQALGVVTFAALQFKGLAASPPPGVDVRLRAGI